MVRQLGYSMFQTVDNNSFPAVGGSFLRYTTHTLNLIYLRNNHWVLNSLAYLFRSFHQLCLVFNSFQQISSICAPRPFPCRQSWILPTSSNLTVLCLIDPISSWHLGWYLALDLLHSHNGWLSESSATANPSRIRGFLSWVSVCLIWFYMMQLICIDFI